MNHKKYIIVCCLLSFEGHSQVISVRAKRILNAPTTINSANNLNYKQSNRALDNLLPGQMATGSSQTIFARGLESYHTKMEIDGIEANDPSAPTKTFNFNFAPSLMNGKFQYLGPESNIYSNGLAASTVVYQTGSSDKDQNQISFSNGSYGQNKFTAAVGDKVSVDNNFLNSFNYNLLANIDETQGRDFSQNNGDKDGYSKKDFHAVINGNFKYSQVKLVGHSYDYKESLDGNINEQGKYVEDPNRDLKSNMGLYGIFVENYFTDKITQKISYSKNVTKRQEVNLADSFNSNTESKEIYKGNDSWLKNALTIEDQERSYFLEAQLNFGNESSSSKNSWEEFEKGLSKTQYSIKGQKSLGDAYLFAGTTVLKRQSTRPAENLTVGPGFNFNEYLSVQLQASRNEEVPSLFQLNAPTYGNKFLSNEIIKSRSVTLTFKNNSTKFKVTPFSSTIENRFSFDPVTYQSINSGKADISGIQNEFSTTWKIIHLNANSIYQKTKDTKTNKSLYRRAPFSIIETLALTPVDNSTISISHSYKDKRDEFQGTLPSYNKWDINLSQKIDDFSFSFTIENLLNKKYQDTYEVLPSERTLLASVIWKI